MSPHGVLDSHQYKPSGKGNSVIDFFNIKYKDVISDIYIYKENRKIQCSTKLFS